MTETAVIERPTLTKANTTKSATTFTFSNGAKVRTTKSYPYLFVRTTTYEDNTGTAQVYKGTGSFVTARLEAEKAIASSGHHFRGKLLTARYDYFCLHFKGGEYVEERRP